MIEGRKLAIYAFLTELEACERKRLVFDTRYTPTRYDLDFVLTASLADPVAYLIQNMLAFMDCKDRRYFTEQAVMIAAHEYARLPWADNTFYERFKALDNCTVLSADEANALF